MNVLKKIFSVSVAFTTILWSLGVSAFVPAVAVAAGCPALNPGDMIKVSGKAAIYVLNNDRKVLYFPSGDEFKSWRPNYGGYISIDQSCYDSLSVPSTYPGGVNFAPGSYIVKRPSSDQLYVVEPGNTLAKIDTAAAKALYGASYKVMTVADQFWPNYVNRGSDITGSGAQVHPGMLVMNGGKTWYVDTGMKLWMVSASGMTANGFQSKFVHTVADSAVAGLAQGGTLDSELKSITDKTQSGGVVAVAPGTPVTVVSGSTTVSLAADNPFAATVISDATNGAQAQIKVLKLVFWAGNDGDVVVTSLKLSRGGVSADTDISNMYLYDGMNQVAGNPSVASGKVTFTNASGLFTVPKGSSKTIEVRLDLKNAVAAGKTISFSIASNSDVTTSGNSSVGGSYPLAGNVFTVAATSDLGKLAFTSITPSAAGTVDPGTTGFELWRFQVQNTAQDMEVRQLNFTVVGSVNVGDLQNFSLWDGATQIGTSVAGLGSNKTVMFNLTASPYVITKGQTRILSLKADIVGGTNRSFYVSLQNASDIVTFDRNYQVFVKPNGTDTFAIVQPTSGNLGVTTVNWSVNTGSLTQLLATDSPTGNVALSSTNVTLAKFGWKANGEDVKVTSLSVSSTVTSGRTLNNVRLLVNGSQVGTTINTLTGNGVANSGWGTFGSSFIIKAGTTASVAVVADLSGSATTGDTIVAGVVAGTSNAQGTVSLTNISTTAKNGNTLTVKSGTVAVAKNAAFGEKSSTNPTGTVNGSQQRVGSFVITAGAGEDVTVSQITLEDFSTSNCIGTYMQNLTLKDSSQKQLGQTYSNPSTTCTSRNTYTFNLSPAVTVTNGSQYTVDVYGDLKVTFTGATPLVDVYSVTASGKLTGSNASVTPSAQSVPLQAMYISGAGSVMVQVDSDTPIATNYLMGATDQTIGKFKLSASTTEAVNISQLVISAKFSTGATGTLTNIRLIDMDTGNPVGNAVSAFSDTVAGASSPTGTYSHATFSNLTFKVPAGSSKTLAVKVDFSTYQNGGFTTTGQTVEPVVLQSYSTAGSSNPVTATGDSSGTSLTATVSTVGAVNTYGTGLGAYGATTTLYRAKLTTAWAGDTPSGASAPGASQIVAKFVVTNLANAGNYTATIKSINFDLSSTISNTANRALTVYKDAVNTSALATTSTVAGSNEPFEDTTLSDAAFTDVDISSGASKTFFVTLDTTNAAQSKSLSVRVGNADISWTDGVSTVTAMGQDLPLLYKTFTY